MQYSEGIDVGYRWYDSKGLTPLFPFGYGLSYTTFSFTNLTVGPLTAGGAATVTATVTNTGSRSGADVAQLYVTDPSASGQPPLQLEGFQRVNLAAGASTTVTFSLTQQNLQYWNSSSNAWATSTGNYTISVGDSSASLPLTGTLPVASSQLGQPVTLASPGPQASLTNQAASSVTLSGTDTTSGQTLTYSAAGLPAGLSISSAGVISGTPATAGTSTVTVTAKDGNGAYATQSFVWTVSPGSGTPPPPPPASLQISAGGPATGTWAADEDFSGGTTTSTTHAITTTGVTNPAPQSVYQHNRYGNFTYAVPGFTAGATYTVRLHFAEDVLVDGGLADLQRAHQRDAGADQLRHPGHRRRRVQGGGGAVHRDRPQQRRHHHPVRHRQGQRPGQRHRDPVVLEPGATADAHRPRRDRRQRLGGAVLDRQRGCHQLQHLPRHRVRRRRHHAGRHGHVEQLHRHRADQRHHVLLQGHREQQRRHVGAVQRGARDADTTTPPPTGVQINAGGPAVAPFAADEDFTGGATAAVTHAIDTSGVTNPAPQAVYQSNRYGNFTYTVPGLTAGANYTVRLHFAEEYWTTAGSRTFNVTINGKQVLTNFDILATAGAEYKAVVEQFTEAADSTGKMTIQFTTVKDNAQVNGIEILS